MYCEVSNVEVKYKIKIAKGCIVDSCKVPIHEVV
jgi:hypothetical protein